jgi:hypothetical protein
MEFTHHACHRPVRKKGRGCTPLPFTVSDVKKSVALQELLSQIRRMGSGRSRNSRLFWQALVNEVEDGV